jgi:hypothetical protein
MWPDDDGPHTCFIAMDVMTSDSERLPPTRSAVEILRMWLDSEKTVENCVTSTVCVKYVHVQEFGEETL